MIRALVNGVEADSLPLTDRGLHYGDGVFETVLFVRGRSPLWREHMHRLATGCARLHLSLQEDATLADECEQAIAGIGRAVVKIMITRGNGGRGYASHAATDATRIVLAYAAPEVPDAWYRDGVDVRWCELRLGANPALAGIKHLNRLEQVLARAEWTGAAIAEGLLCDGEGRVICATAANIFAVIDGSLVTPALQRCGVAGVARARILAEPVAGFVATVRDILVSDLDRADEVFLSSSVRGVVPVRGIGARAYDIGNATRALQRYFAASGVQPGSGI